VDYHNLDIDSTALIWDYWRSHAEKSPSKEAIVHVVAEEDPFRWQWLPLMNAASSASRWLSDRGVKKGDVCALIVRHDPYFYPLYMAITALGALPAVLAYPNARLHPTKFRQGIEGMSQRSGLDHLLTERQLVGVVQPLAANPASSTIRNVLCPLDDVAACFGDGLGLAEHVAAESVEPCLLQHSSGTTGLQKPVVLSHRAVLEHIRRYGGAIELNEADRIASWLPLYHDMGLIAGFYLPLICGVPLVQLSPLEWVASPVTLLSAISKEKATLCWLPNFSYNFMADRIRDEDLQEVRLDSLRMLVNCSEPVRAESHDRFHRRFASCGLRREVLTASYAMAETTFAATQTAPGQQARRLVTDRAALANGTVVLADGARVDSIRVCVSSGLPISGCAVRILDENRRELPPDCVGEIALSSVSLFDGYRNYPEKTAEVLANGWYLSGDYGFVHDNECYVIGRKKDIIIIAGNNVFPEDVEDAVGKVPGVLPGRVVAFGVDDERLGTQVLCTVVESEAKSSDEKMALRAAVMQAGISIDVTISRVYIAEPRWLIKSSSGKPARSTNRSRALEELTWK
jgi:fatty-acyl-CoA synthase